MMSPGDEYDTNRASTYQIRIRGHLGPSWTEWFQEGVSISLEADGEALLTAEAVDQAGLHGLLKRLLRLGIPVLAVYRLDRREIAADSTKGASER